MRLALGLRLTRRQQDEITGPGRGEFGLVPDGRRCAGALDQSAVGLMPSEDEEQAGAVAPDRGQRGAGEAARVRAHGPRAEANAVTAILHGLRDVADLEFPRALPEWMVEGCELVCAAGEFASVSEMLGTLAARTDIGAEVRRRSAVLLAREGDQRGASALRILCDDKGTPLGERVLAAWELAGMEPEQARAALIDFTRPPAIDVRDLDELVDRRTAAKALSACGFHAESASALEVMRDHPAGDEHHRTRCDELWGVAVLAATRANGKVST